MSKSIGILSCVTFAAALAITPPASAQTSQWCPPAGTVTKRTTSRGETTTTSKGADPADSTVCMSVTVGTGVSGTDYGKLMRRLYGWYDLTNYTHPQETMKNARDGLGAILSGRIQEISFEMTTVTASASYVWSGTQTWKRMGETTISIGGHPTKVIMLRSSFKGGANSNYDGYSDVWVDPALHIWVKLEEHAVGGPVRFAAEVVSVTPP